MENLKLVRKVKKITNRQLQRERDMLAATQVRMPVYCSANRDNYDPYFESNSSQEDYFSTLSDELILAIFKWIPKTYLLKYATVCKRWHTLIFDETLWKYYDLSNKIVHGEKLVKLLNIGVKLFSLQQAEVRKSKKKFFNPTETTSLATQIDTHLLSTTNVEYLDLTSTVIDINSMNALLKHCKNLKVLSLESLKVNNQTFVYLSQNKQLKTLNLAMTEGVQVEGLILILSSLKMLKNFNIGWSYLDRECVVLLCRHLPPTIERFNLSGCRTTLLDSDVENLVVACPNLIELDISDAQSLTSVSVEYIASSLTKIQRISFSRCYSILPSSYLLLSQCPNLVSIDLFNILKEKSIETLKTYITSLLYVNRYPFSSIARPVFSLRSIE